MILDSSQIADYQRCPMKWFLRYSLGIEKKRTDEREADREFGKRVHLFLEKYYKKEEVDLNEIWSTYFQGNEKHKTTEGGLFLCKNFPKFLERIDSQFETIAVEIKDEVKLSDNMSVVVKLDRLVKNQDNIYIVEYKTTSSIYQGYFSRYLIDGKSTAYVNYVKEKYGQCSGIILIAGEIKYYDKPSSPLLHKNSPEIEDYSQSEIKYSKHYGEEMAYCQGYHTKYEMEIINRTKEELEDWKENCILWINDMNKSIETNSFKKGDCGGACSLFKGCEYRELCKMSKGMMFDADILNQIYQHIENPLAYLEE